MSELDSGGSAFPIISERGSMPDSEPGMTLRDYFAAKSMQSLIARSDWDSQTDFFAEWSYEMADSMLKARK